MVPLITLELTVAEVNAILASLGKQPFEHVAALIQNIQNQGIPQAQAIEATEPPAPTE